MIGRIYGGVKRNIILHWRRILLLAGSGVLLTFLVIQILYPSSRLLPGTKIDRITIGGWSKQKAISFLDLKYKNVELPLYFGTATKPYKSPLPSEIGLAISNTTRINSLNYPWYLRIIPSSIFWAHSFIALDRPTYTRNKATTSAYIAKQLGASCKVEPIDAMVKVSTNKLTLVKSVDGGTCTTDEVSKALGTVTPTIDTTNDIHIAMKSIVPSTSDATVQKLVESINAKVEDGVPLIVAGSRQTIPAAQFLSWLDFSSQAGAITFDISQTRAASYLGSQVTPKVFVQAGVSQVATYDFSETSRQTGTNGQTLDSTATLLQLKDYLLNIATTPVAQTAVVAPSVNYMRSYSPTDTGLTALITNYATSHPGTYGVSLYELDGKLRHAAYNDKQSFITASTYKLFVAYSSLLRIESGAWHWSDQIQGGNDLSTCFDKMIKLSDNACAKALLEKIGFTAITNEAHAIGCVHTSFLGKDGIVSTAADESLFVGMLQSGQILSQQSSRDRLIGDMKLNIYRQGIPAGANGTVADKVGFLDAYLHDAAIVYSPSGTYVLVIMTNNSTWANIADLTKQIEALRIQ